MKAKHSGFTLVELMVTVAMVAILASLAVPSFRILLVNRTVQAASESLIEDMRLARSEALKRSTRTVICRSTDSSTCVGAAGSWSDGWIVFVDIDSSGQRDNAETLLKVQQPLTNIASIQDPAGAASTIHTFRYEPTGWAKAATQSMVVTPAGAVPANSTRLICVSVTGRPALRTVGTAIC
jgi:type IV fimbrial biogenesis protein FimT